MSYHMSFESRKFVMYLVPINDSAAYKYDLILYIFKILNVV